MLLRKITFLTALLFTFVGVARAAELAGKWTAEFESPIGVQKYAYEFKAEGDKLTGKATFEHSMGKGDAPLKDIKVKGDEVAFAETMKIQDMEIVITYTGKLAGDELKLTRTVGDFGTEQLVAKRVKAPSPAAK
jgi:hypothetical protein